MVDLQLSAWGGRRFAVNHGSMGLFPPREFMVFPTGGRLPRGRSCDGWWSASTPEEADNSMQEVMQIFELHALPFFQQGSVLSGFAAQLEALLPSPKGHTHFDLACCVARLGERERAFALLAQAITLYRQYHTNTGAAWCLPCIEHAQELTDALSVHSESALLDRWRDQSVAALKLTECA